jgi:hypothetical protein
MVFIAAAAGQGQFVGPVTLGPCRAHSEVAFEAVRPVRCRLVNWSTMLPGAAGMPVVFIDEPKLDEMMGPV